MLEFLQQRKDIRVEQKQGVNAGIPAAKGRHKGWAKALNPCWNSCSKGKTLGLSKSIEH
jgi:hypothetical protein